MSHRNDGLRVIWERTPFPVSAEGMFAPHSGNNVYILAKRPRPQSLQDEMHSAGQQLQAIRVGSGVALDELLQCAGREEIRQHDDDQYELIAFSCCITDSLREGTERFLADDLLPLIGERTPNAMPNRINPPAVLWSRSGGGAPLRKAS
jgi:hypothetical protein